MLYFHLSPTSYTYVIKKKNLNFILLFHIYCSSHVWKINFFYLDIVNFSEHMTNNCKRITLEKPVSYFLSIYSVSCSFVFFNYAYNVGLEPLFHILQFKIIILIESVLIKFLLSLVGVTFNLQTESNTCI